MPSAAARPVPSTRCSAVQVGHLGRIQVAGAGPQDPRFGHWPEAEPGGDQLGPVASQQPQRQAAEITRGRGLERLHVPVRVEPDDPGIDPGARQARDRPHGRVAIAGDDHREAAVPGLTSHRIRDRGVQAGQPGPDVARRQLRGDDLAIGKRQVQIGQLLVKVIGNGDDGHAPRLTPGRAEGATAGRAPVAPQPAGRAPPARRHARLAGARPTAAR